jgi:hypothetical protein
VTSHTLSSTPAVVQRRESGGQAAAVAADLSSIVGDPRESMTRTGNSPDVVALVWDLTVHRLHRAFAECLATRPDPTHGAQIPTAASTSSAGTGLDGVRLAATRHAVDDIQDALRRMAAGSYGICQRCARPIGEQRLRATPTARWCPACDADRCGEAGQGTAFD